MFSRVVVLLLVVLLVMAMFARRMAMRREHFSISPFDSFPECNKMMANSTSTENVQCQYIWKAPVYLSEGASLPTQRDMQFQDSTNASSPQTMDIAEVMQNATGLAQIDCKTNEDITHRVNAAVEKIQQTIAKDNTKKYFDEILSTSVYMPYYVKMTDKFKYDVDNG